MEHRQDGNGCHKDKNVVFFPLLCSLKLRNSEDNIFIYTIRIIGSLIHLNYYLLHLCILTFLSLERFMDY